MPKLDFSPEIFQAAWRVFSPPQSRLKNLIDELAGSFKKVIDRKEK